MFEDDLRKDLEYILDKVPILYKYMCFQGSVKMLSESKLMFTNPVFFNDPYDCYLGLIKFDNIPESHLEEIFFENFNSLNEQGRINISEILNTKSKTELKVELIRNYREIALPAFLSTNGITCFSEKANDLLMWSHYSDSHNGVCIGFDLIKLLYSLKKFFNNEIRINRVIYTYTFDPIDYLEEGNKSIINWLRTKSKNWEYEKEIRITMTPVIFDKKGHYFVPFDREVVNKIIIGSKMRDSDEKKLIGICRKNYPNAALFKMQLDKKSFNLIAKPIDEIK